MKLTNIKSFEQECQQEWNDDQLFEMANITSRFHGIGDVVIWVGIAPKQHGLRVKVSNVKNKFDINNHFVIKMPSLDYNPNAIAKWIDRKKLNAILSWIKINQKLLHDYETGLISDTQEFLNNISKV